MLNFSCSHTHANVRAHTQIQSSELVLCLLLYELWMQGVVPSYLPSKLVKDNMLVGGASKVNENTHPH